MRVLFYARKAALIILALWAVTFVARVANDVHTIAQNSKQTTAFYQANSEDTLPEMAGCDYKGNSNPSAVNGAGWYCP